MGRFNIGKNKKPVDCRVKIGLNDETDGEIIRQKGSKKFLVTDGKNTGTCVLSDYANGDLANDTMTITIKASDEEKRLEYISNKFGVDFSGNRYILTGSKANVLENCEDGALLAPSERQAAPKEEKKVAKKKVAKKKPAKKKAAKKKPEPKVEEPKTEELKTEEVDVQAIEELAITSDNVEDTTAEKTTSFE